MIAFFVLVVGSLGAFFDFLENSIRWAFLTLTASPSETLALAWSVVFSMSFWFMVLAAIIASTAIWSETLIARVSMIVGFLAIPAAALIFPVGYKPLFIWMIIWHGLIGIFLLRVPNEANPAAQTTASPSSGQ